MATYKINCKAPSIKSQRGVAEILFTALALGLFVFFAVFAVDSYLVSLGSLQMKSALLRSCNEAATDAVTSSRLDAGGRFINILNANLQGTILELSSASLYVPGMPDAFNLPSSVASPPDFPSGGESDLSGKTAPGLPAGGSSSCGSSCTYTFSNDTTGYPVDPPEGFPPSSYHSHYDAGSFIGCYAEARLRFLWWRPAGLERIVSAKNAFASGVRGIDPRVAVVNGNQAYPAVVVGIAPQVMTGAPLPQTGIPALDGTNLFIFRDVQLDKPHYQTIRTNNGTLIQEPNTTDFLTWPRLVANPASVNNVRSGLYAACASSPVVLRQRATSALLELFSRHGATRESTSVLVSNPFRGNTLGGYGAAPVELVELGNDLRDEDYHLPLLNPVFSDTIYQPLVADIAPNNPNAEYGSLISRMQGLCYHIDTVASERRKRLRVATDYPLSYVVNAGYEGNAFTGRTTTGLGFVGANNEYFDLLGYWSAPTGSQRRLSAPMMASVLGAQLACPFAVDPNYCASPPILEPDVVGIMNAWANGSQVLPSPGLGETPASPSFEQRERALVLITHEMSMDQWQEVGNRLPSLAVGEQPVTIIYIPTTSPVGGFDNQLMDIINRLGVDKIKTCRPAFQNDADLESHVFIPIVPTEGNAVPNFPCLTEHFFCMATSSDLDELWECLLDDTETSIENMIKEQVFLSYDRSPIMEIYRKL